jgi:hypothetical protein
MGLDQIWQNTLQYGALFLLFVGVVLFYTGRLVSGDLAKHAQERELAAVEQAHKDAMQAFKERYDEMQTTWRERFTELTRDRDYFRAIASQLAQQTEQAISTQEVAIKNNIPGARRQT